MNLTIDSQQENKKARRRCKMVQGQMRASNAPYGRNGWLGLATIGLNSNGDIDRGTAKMNDRYSWNAEDRNHVACQEIWVAPRRDGGLWVHHVILAP